MEKTVEEICNNIINANFGIDKSTQKIKNQRLSDCVNCNNLEFSSVLYNYDGLYNVLERSIAQKLACAIDDNDVYKVKKLKEQYGNTKEFSDAKKFLDRKCKEVWNVYTDLKKVPKEAMKTLGISNQPSLDFLLKNCLLQCSADGDNITAISISAILKNPNLSYSIDDIYEYLKIMNKKFNYSCNFMTIRYLINAHNFGIDKLYSLGANKEIIKKALKGLPFRIKIKYNCLLFL